VSTTSYRAPPAFRPAIPLAAISQWLVYRLFVAADAELVGFARGTAMLADAEAPFDLCAMLGGNPSRPL
jgi:hypothetical protein